MGGPGYLIWDDKASVKVLAIFQLIRRSPQCLKRSCNFQVCIFALCCHLFFIFTGMLSENVVSSVSLIIHISLTLKSEISMHSHF